MEKLIKIKKCEVCGSSSMETVLDLGQHPLCDDLISINSDSICLEYPIEILFCKKCSTAHQKYQVPQRELFPNTYHYRSRFTADVLNAMDSLIDSIQRFKGELNGKVVLDIGCNDGSLLDKFAIKGAITTGVEPTMAFEDALGKGHDIYNEFFNEKIALKLLEKYDQIDIITFTNVFAHIEDLENLLKALKCLISDETILVIENHYLGAVLEKKQFDTFYHEHPRTYSLSSFLFIAKSLSRDVINVEFPSRYGGNIRVFIGNSKNSYKDCSNLIENIIAKEAFFHNQFKILADFVDYWKIEKKAEINKLVELHGKLVAKAFPGRAAILVKMLGLTNNEIHAVYEKPGSLKIGYYVPGTKIPIQSDEVLFEDVNKNKIILNLAWHISAEIENYLKSNGFLGEIDNILE